MIDRWVKFDPSMEITDEVSFINVDTRDFHWLLGTEIPNEYTKEIAVSADNKYLISKEDMIKWINDLKEKTGGDGDWRHIELKDGHGGDRWLKYVWFVRVTWTHFVMMTRTGNLLEMDKIFEEIDWSNPYIMIDNYGCKNTTTNC